MPFAALVIADKDRLGREQFETNHILPRQSSGRTLTRLLLGGLRQGSTPVARMRYSGDIVPGISTDVPSEPQ